MRKRDFERLIGMLGTASPAQLRVTENRLLELNNANATLLLAEGRVTHGTETPECASRQEWSTAD